MITITTFDGFEAVEISTSQWKMIMVTECGPRIAFLGKLDGENILYWDKDGASKENWKLYGGHRVWITRPYADESEDTYMEDNAPCEVEIAENSVIATANPHDFTKLSRGIKVEVLSDDTFKVTNIIKNDGSLIYSGGVWSPTCINPEGKKIYVDLGEDDTTWDIVKIIIPRKFAGNEVRINDEQITFTDDQMILTPKGVLTKRCVCAPKGRVYMNWAEKNITFTKQVSYNRNGRYPLDGCNVAVFLGDDNWMAEMETFGEEQVIRPGEIITNEEVWTVKENR
jgi:hypothetical protein